MKTQIGVNAKNRQLQDKVDHYITLVAVLQAEATDLKAILAKLPKCWRLNETRELVRDVPITPTTMVFVLGTKESSGPHRVTDPWRVQAVYNGLVEIEKGQTVKLMPATCCYLTREAAEAAKEE